MHFTMAKSVLYILKYLLLADFWSGIASYIQLSLKTCSLSYLHAFIKGNQISIQT